MQTPKLEPNIAQTRANISQTRTKIARNRSDCVFVVRRCTQTGGQSTAKKNIHTLIKTAQPKLQFAHFMHIRLSAHFPLQINQLPVMAPSERICRYEFIRIVAQLSNFQ